jgi:hypothetical protein
MRTLLSVVIVLALVGSALAQDEKKQEGGGAGLLGLPAPKELKDKCGWDDEQVKKGEKVNEEYKTKAEEAQKNAKDSADKKAAGKALRDLRTEISGKLREICKDDEQKKKFDEATAPKKKK